MEKIVRAEGNKMENRKTMEKIRETNNVIY